MKKNNLFAELKKSKNQAFFMALAVSIASLCAGIIMVIFPSMTFLAITIVLGLVLVVRGLTALINYDYAQNKRPSFLARIMLFFDLLSLLFGLICLISPATVSTLIAYVVALFLLASGINALSGNSLKTFGLKKAPAGDQIVAFFHIFLALVLFLAPGLAGASLGLILGIIMLLFGLSSFGQILNWWKLRK